MPKEMVISANPHETRVAILEEGQLCEYYVEREKEFALVGSIYKGRVTRVLPGMQSAFVEIGLDSDAFLYVTDFLEGIEEFEPIVATVEDKTKKMQEQGGQVFPANGGTLAAIEPPDVESAVPDTAAHHADTASQSTAEPTQSGNNWTAPAPSGQRQESSGENRGRFDSRRQGGRDFGRRGGRGGRFGSRGGRGGDHRFGRELPPSKYASPRQHEEPAEGASPSEPYVPVLLPGESLARFKDKPAAALEAVTPHEETLSNAAPVTEAATRAPEAQLPREPSAANEPAQPLSDPAAVEEQSFRPAARSFERHEHSAPLASALEPLPGESLAKFRHEPPSPPVQSPAEEAGELASALDAEDHEHEELHAEVHQETNEPLHSDAREEVEHHLHQQHPDLSEDEAAAIAEHVAEAQSEEAERQQESEAAAHEGHPEQDDDREEGDEHDGHLAAGEVGAPYESEHAEHGGEEFEHESEAESLSDAQHEHESGERTEDIAAESAAEQVGDQIGEQIGEHAGESLGELPGEQISQPQAERQPFAARVRDDFRPRMQHPNPRRGRDRDRDRGRRPHHGRPSHGHHRPQNRRPQLIADMLKQGQEIIVQIAKEPLGKKGARITSHVALPGRYLVYMPTLDHSGVSRKIASAEERSRLRHLVNDAKGNAPGGFIVRTAAAAAAPEEVRADVEFLTHTWSEIKSRSEQRKAPSLLHRDLNLVERILRDHMNSDYTAIWVDSEEAYTKVTEFISRFQSALANRVKLYSKETPIFEEFGIQQEIEKGLRPKVWLKSGGYIVINHTEALVAIDVNTGKFVGKGSNRLEDTIVRTNLEAAKEIVRQMRLRDLGGIIVIDFIDMEDRRNREKVMAALEDALRTDRAPSKMLRFNEFGLIAITRKRTKQALERTLCQPCPYCTGSGMVKSIPTLCYEIQTEARKMAPDIESGSITLRVHPEIAKALKTRESSLVEELESSCKKSAIIQADPTLHWEQYDI
ncbi:MAG TPA: Rne/Rng family ribonuclease, partial [Candidatus Dormibacteraeota bacterium]|nr:Rne/Rng family ribonuclease [Candidatus Dormibacteraeota bacterium]